MNFMLPVTIAAVTLALVMAVVAWRVVGEERRRSAARVAALAAEIHRLAGSTGPELPRPGTAGTVFATAEIPRERRGLATAIGAGAVVVAGVAAVLVLATIGADPVASSRAANETARPSPAVQRPAVAPSPALELMTLSHEREQDRLVVRGTVRNPGTGLSSTHLTAVVLLFNADGGFITSGRAEVSTRGLPAGAAASFVVTIPGASEVGRYRVSFRSDDRVVPHVDRRRS